MIITNFLTGLTNGSKQCASHVLDVISELAAVPAHVPAPPDIMLAEVQTVQIACTAHHLMHYKTRAKVLILRKILTCNMYHAQIFERKLGQGNFHNLSHPRMESAAAPSGCRSRVHRQIFGA